MTTQARVSPWWVGKWTVIGLVLIAFGGWCLYDALIAYPAHNRKVAAFMHHMQSEALQEQWPEYARAHGWSPRKPHPAEPYSTWDIRTQWIYLAIAWPVGFLALAGAGLSYNRKITADEQGVTGPRGRFAAYEQIVRVDKTRWDRKGVALLRYRVEEDARSIRFNDWKYENAEPVLDLIEQRVGPGVVIEEPEERREAWD